MSNLTPSQHYVPEVFHSLRAKTGRLVHLIPDEIAREAPDHPLFSYAKGAKPQDGFIDVSAKQFANAVNRTSWYLETFLGKPKGFETVAYMGPSKHTHAVTPSYSRRSNSLSKDDIRYFLFMFGAIKVGYKVSNGNSTKTLTRLRG